MATAGGPTHDATLDGIVVVRGGSMTRYDFSGMRTGQPVPRVLLSTEDLVIAEALSFGLPALISDRTPWLDLESRNVGWTMPLDDENLWCWCLQERVDMDSDEYADASRAAIEYIAHRKHDGEDLACNRLLFGLPSPVGQA